MATDPCQATLPTRFDGYYHAASFSFASSLPTNHLRLQTTSPHRSPQSTQPSTDSLPGPSTSPTRDLNSSTQTPSSSRPPGWVHFVAGGLGGMCGATVTAPFDLVKTRLQSSTYSNRPLNLGLSAPSPPPSGSVARQPSGRLFYHFIDTGKIIRDIRRTEGFRALFRGLGPTLVGAIPARAINFYVYGTGKEFYSQVLLPSTGDSSSLVHICSAITAGIATATATNPIWVVKTRLQLDQPSSPLPRPPVRAEPSPSERFSRGDPLGARPRTRPPILPEPPTYSNQPNRLLTPLGTSLQCITKIYQQEGMVGFYRGLSASYLGVAEGTIQWTLYEKFKRWGSHLNGEEYIAKEESWTSKMFAAGAAKLIATGITYPHEVIRTRLRQKPPPLPLQPKYTGLYSTFKTILAEEGPKALYGGLSPHLLRVVPNAVVMYTVYEAALSFSRSSLTV